MIHIILGEEIFVDGHTGCFAKTQDDLNLTVSNSFDFDKYIPNFDEYKTTSVTFCINFSNACNLKCDYCFNDKKDGESLNLDDIYVFLDRCFTTFPNKEKYFVDLSGKGEPLLFLKKILEIKRYCDNWSNKLRREVLVQFVTNGTLLSKEVAEILQKNGILLGVSLDGDELTHNKHRKDPNGNPTYKQVINNVKAIEHHEYVGAACTLTKDVFSLNDSLNELSKTFNTVSYKPARNCFESFDEESLNQWLSSYDELVKALIEESLGGDIRRTKILLNGEDYLGKFMHRVILNQRTIVRCDAGLSRFALDKDGAIYACPASSLMDKFSIGKGFAIDFSKSREMFKEQTANSLCHECDFRYLCGGECPVEKHLSNGVNKIMCRYKSHLILLSIYFALTLFERNQKAFFELRDFCLEVNARKKLDAKLMTFLDENPQLSFIEGKKIFDSLQKRY